MVLKCVLCSALAFVAAAYSGSFFSHVPAGQCSGPCPTQSKESLALVQRHASALTSMDKARNSTVLQQKLQMAMKDLAMKRVEDKHKAMREIARREEEHKDKQEIAKSENNIAKQKDASRSPPTSPTLSAGSSQTLLSLSLFSAMVMSREGVAMVVALFTMAALSAIAVLIACSGSDHAARIRGEPNARSDPCPRTLDGYVAITARTHPNAVAVEIPRHGDASKEILTYAQLDTLSADLASRVQGMLGGKSDDRIVAILTMPNSMHTFVAFVAIWKAHAATLYVPPKYPSERIRCVLDDAKPALALISGPASHELNVPTFDMNRWWCNQPDKHAGCWQDIQPESAAHLAYIIYTSGTTGKPKGVMIEHSQICNLVASNLRYFDLGVGDRVAQVASLAFDASIEEMFLAWGAGGTLVVHGQLEDFGQWLRDERITLVTPTPSMLRLAQHNIRRGGFPDLRIVYPGGEPMTSDDVGKWGGLPGLRLVNAYGPTECAVTVVRGPLNPGERVAIGEPIENNEAWILGGTDLELCEEGELCIVGAQVARGYFGKEDLTRERFPYHPRLGRMYRTGDVVCRDVSGRLVCFGRIDNQVKVRGVRIELEEVETHLAQLPGVDRAACTVQSTGETQRLVAFVVPVAKCSVDIVGIRRRLSSILPPSMVPDAVESLACLPMNANGKLDRSALPRASGQPACAELGASNSVEVQIAIIFATALGLATCPCDADFFQMGGNSYSSALVVTRLRGDAGYTKMSMRTLYDRPTVKSLAQWCSDQAAVDKATYAQKSPEETTIAAPGAAARLSGFWCFAVQLLSMFMEILVFGIVIGEVVPAYYGLLYHMPQIGNQRVFCILLSFAAWTVFELGMMLVIVLLVALLKRLIIQKIPTGRYPIYGLVYTRLWLARRLNRYIPWSRLEGTEFYCMTLRLLGADIGKDVHIRHDYKGSPFEASWDLLSIADRATINSGAIMRAYDFEDNDVILGHIVLGEGATVGKSSTVCPSTTLETKCYLESQSVLSACLPGVAGSVLRGNPAEAIGNAIVSDACGYEWPAMSFSIVLLLARTVIDGLQFAFETGVLIGTLELACYLRGAELNTSHIFNYTPITSTFYALCVVTLPCGKVFFDLMRALFVRAMFVREGVYHLRSWESVLMHLQIDQSAHVLGHASGTMFTPIWLRVAGSRVGYNSECEYMVDVVPGMWSVGKECFFATNVKSESPLFHHGTLHNVPVAIGEGVFLSDCTVPVGCAVPHNSFIGIGTRAPDIIPDGTAWFGTPPFQLPRREVVAADRSCTHEPPWYFVVVRFIIESANFLVAELKILAGLFTITLISILSPWMDKKIMGPVVAILTLAYAMSLIPLLLKWVLGFGNMSAKVVPLWSSTGFVSRLDLAARAGQFCSPDIMYGTPFAYLWPSLMGADIGSNFFCWEYGGNHEPDLDLVKIEDDVTITRMVGWTHLFEDRMLKFDQITIGKGATLQDNAQILPGATVGRGSKMQAGCLLPKGENIPPGAIAFGHPAELVPGVRRMFSPEAAKA